MAHIAIVVGARPNFMKAAPILHALRAFDHVTVSLVHTGQHYDEGMSGSFLRDLDLQAPGTNLGVGSGSHGRQTGEVLARFEAFLEESPQDLVIVVGDVNSTLAAALAAIKRHIPVAHVEAGLRSGDRSMPEEINRLATDAISSLLFVTEPSGMHNLANEGVPDDRRFLVGNTMIDTLLKFAPRARALPQKADLPERYGVLTLHRPSNVDDEQTLVGILDALEHISKDLPLLWPIHPRTENRLREFGLMERVEDAVQAGAILRFPPQGYVDFLAWNAGATLILTDSGGIQEEALVLRVPVVTLRENTERPVTVDAGSNLLAGSDKDRILKAAEIMLARDPQTFAIPPEWDGRSGERIAQILVDRLAAGIAL